MITQNGNLFIGLVVEIYLLLHCHAFQVEFLELVLKGEGGIIGTENFGGEALHHRFQVVIQGLCINFIKKILTSFLIFLKFFDCTTDLAPHSYCILISHRVLSQEIKSDLIFRQDPNMLDSQRTAPYGISFFLTIFLVSGS